jgi:hypothetical protein
VPPRAEPIIGLDIARASPEFTRGPHPRRAHGDDRAPAAAPRPHSHTQADRGGGGGGGGPMGVVSVRWAQGLAQWVRWVQWWVVGAVMGGGRGGGQWAQ